MTLNDSFRAACCVSVSEVITWRLVKRTQQECGNHCVKVASWGALLTNICWIIRSGRMRVAVHVARMEDICKVGVNRKFPELFCDKYSCIITPEGEGSPAKYSWARDLPLLSVTAANIRQQPSALPLHYILCAE
jgi:hypothetical protein